MATYLFLKSEVSDILDDSSLDYLVGRKINEGLRNVAGKMLLPKLRTTGTIATDVDNKVAMPSDYHRHLSPWAHSTTHNRRIKVYESVPELMKWFSTIDLAGNVVGLAREGTEIYYQRIPASAETIMLNYFKLPTALDADTDTPDCLPDHLHEELLINYALWKLFQHVEDGTEGEGANTARYKAEYNTAVAELIYFIGPTSDVPVWPEDELGYDCLVNL